MIATGRHSTIIPRAVNGEGGKGEMPALRGGRAGRRKWQPIPAFLPGKSHGQRSLVGHSLWGHRVRHNGAHTNTHKMDMYYV